MSGAVEAYLSRHAECHPIARRWFQHDERSVRDFYPAVAARDHTGWSLVRDLFISGPSHAVLFRGTSPIRALSAIKGASHPALAAPITVRARFWCDNPVCNLLHVSDDPDEAARELGILARLGIEWPDDLDGPHASLPPSNEAIRVEHSGAVVFLRALGRLAALSGEPHVFGGRVPSGAHAWAGQLELEASLRLVRAESSSEVAEYIDAFFAGDPSLARTLHRRALTSPWEDLVLRARLNAQPQWTHATLPDVIETVRRAFAALPGWVISGSAALALQGIDASPSDIDLWCTQETLLAIAAAVGSDVEPKVVGELRGGRVRWPFGGWEFEAVGPMVRGAIRLEPDAELLARARGGLESMEDLVAELLVLDRGVPKHDVRRARDIVRSHHRGLDLEYLRRRARLWQVDPEPVLDLSP